MFAEEDTVAGDQAGAPTEAAAATFTIEVSA